MRGFGDLEAVIMDRLWTWNRPATVREVLEDLQAYRDIAYTTVMLYSVLDEAGDRGAVLTLELPFLGEPDRGAERGTGLASHGVTRVAGGILANHLGSFYGK
jgi:Penicillinase repressor